MQSKSNVATQTASAGISVIIANGKRDNILVKLMNDRENKVRLLIDRDLLRQESIGMHPCINTSSLRIKTVDLTEKLLPAMAHEPTVVDLPWDPE